jgi:hypothetical protein
LLQHHAAEFGDPADEVLPSDCRVKARADPADTHAFLDMAGSRPALVAAGASAAVGFVTPQPLRLKYNAAKLSYAVLEVLPGGSRVLAYAGLANTLTLLDAIGSRPALMALDAPAPVRCLAS